MYTFAFSDQTDILSGFDPLNLHSIYSLEANATSAGVIVRQGSTLTGHRKNSEKWEPLWKKDIFSREENYPLERYPWLVSDYLVADKNVVVIKHPDGVRFYKTGLNSRSLELMKEDGNFHDVYGYELKFGRFYPDANCLGLMARDTHGEISFYVTTKNSLSPDDSDPLLPLDVDLTLGQEWKAKSTDLFVTDLLHRKPQTIGLRTSNGLEFYQFDENYSLQQILRTSLAQKPSNGQDNLFFANVVQEKYQDILQLNSSGLYLFAYRESKNDYDLVHRHGGFTEEYGWSPRYRDTIAFVDINGDRFDDLVFTGQNGLTALSFDTADKKWKEIMSPDSLPEEQRYSNVVGYLANDYQTSVFTQAPSGEVRWARVDQVDTPTTLPTTKEPPPTEPTPPETKTCQTIGMDTTPGRLQNKPVLRWIEQWNKDSLKDALSAQNGEVSFSVPLIDTYATTGWGVKFDLNYHAKSSINSGSLVGENWSVFLAQDFITFDRQNSIRPENSIYYLILQGQVLRLKLSSTERGVQTFQIASTSYENYNVSIEYRPSENKWVVEDSTEVVVYGQDNDALQWSLNWPNWAGTGTDRLGLQPEITSWYLKTRYNKNTAQKLYYSYQNEHTTFYSGKSYTAAIWLKSISDLNDMQVDFFYIQKESSEYIVPNPVSKEGDILFPVPLRESKFLQGYSIVTATFSQSLKFSYDLVNDKRLLSTISQDNETLLKFRYSSQFKDHYISSFEVPSMGSEIKFDYDKLESPTYVLTYPVSEEPKVVKGQNYTIIGYRHPKGNQVALQLLSSDMTKTIQNCLVDIKMSCPKSESEIKELAIVTYENSFVIYVRTEIGQSLFTYSRQGGTWSSEPVEKKFSKDTKLSFSSNFFVAFSPQQNHIAFFVYKDGQWIESMRSIASSAKVALSRHFVTTYDDQYLRLFYASGEIWNERFLPVKSGLELQHFIDRFDVLDDLKQKIVSFFGPYTLQALNNVIVLSTIEEDGGQLYSSVRLYLLGENMDIGHQDIVQIPRENLFSLHEDRSNKNETIHVSIGYVKHEGKYRLEVQKAWGSDFDKIKKQSDRDERIKQFIKKSNEDEGFRNSVKNQTLVDFSYFVNQISDAGVYCGNDTLLQNTGTGWKREQHRPERSIQLGNKFKLNQSEDKGTWFLYRTNESQPIREIKLYSSDKMVNLYPSLIAYQSQVDSVEVLSFLDEETLGKNYILKKEQLLTNNNGHTLMTLANVTGVEEKMELKIRPVTYFSPEILHSVSKVEFRDGDSKRLTSYRRSLSIETKPYTVTQVFTEIPGGDQTKHGFHETTYITKNGNTTKVEKWFDAGGLEVYNPEKGSKTKEKNGNSTDTNPSHLLDRNKKWLISDFTPHSLADEMNAFYGFEDYESGQISSPENQWQLNGTEIIKKQFSFTGQNYLRLANNASLQGHLQPLDQEGAYLASCWLRSTAILQLNRPVPYLKAIIKANGEEIIGLLAQVKNRFSTWSYLELMLDFKTIKEIYKQYASQNSKKSLPPNPKFSITLRVEASSDEIIDLDHIRFFLLSHDFSATVYEPLTGQKSAVIQLNGLVKRNILGRTLENIGEVNEKGQVTKFSSSSRTGKLSHQPNGTTVGNYKPSRLTFEPETGFHEDFDPQSLCNRWEIEEPNAWKFAPRQLWHESPWRHTLVGKTNFIDPDVAAIRCVFVLQQTQASLKLMWNEVVNFEFTRTSDCTCNLRVPPDRVISPLPTSGEIIAMHDHNHAFIWLDGVLLYDQALQEPAPSTSGFSLQVSGIVLIEDVIVMNHPSVKVHYQNSLGQMTQEIQLEDASSALVTETLYDELGRGAITTKSTRISRMIGEALLAYRPNFVINDNSEEFDSVWITGKIRGEVDTFNPDDSGFPYSRTTFAANPLHQETAFGLAGREFSVSGKYSTRYSRQSDLDLVNLLFPDSHGYHHKVQQLPNKSVRVMVFDEKGNQVARYVRVPGYDHSLSTYEYDQGGRLVKILPPVYHEKANTAVKPKPWKPGESHLTDEESKLQGALGTHLSYDEIGNLLKKLTPDSNSAEYVYNSENQIRFMIFSGQGDNHTVYMDYDARGQLWRSGYFQKSNVENGNVVEAQDYQLFHYSYDQDDPLLRGRIKQCITHIDGETVVDKMYLDADEQIISKDTVATFHKHDDTSFKDFKKQFKGEKLHMITYPLKLNGDQLRVVHSYNRLGQLVGLGTSREPYFYAKFAYHPSGQLSQAQYDPGNPQGFIRLYEYNSPGFLERISDPFITEEISFTEGGYGQDGFGDGSVMHTVFNASWTKSADGRWFQVHEETLGIPFANVCLRALKRLGYLTRDGRPLKMFFPSAENRMPLVCSGKSGLKLAVILAGRQPPRGYGHLYSYGTHQELTKAKYFTDETRTLVDPLQPKTFSKEIQGFSGKQSNEVWDLLTKSGFILTDQKRDDPETSIGKRGTSFLRQQELLKDLSLINSNYIIYLEPIKKLITFTIGQRKALSKDDFEKEFLQWEGVDETTSTIVSNKHKKVAREIGQMLEEKGYLKDIKKALNSQFMTVLSDYTTFLSDIIRVLSSKFTHALGESAFDMESYDIDPNGNHRLFYTGPNRYEMLYSPDSNQIHTVKLSGTKEEMETHGMKHDHVGNVIQALHKGIRRIVYHPVSQRTLRIELVDGTVLRFYYDTNGERVLKRVFDSKGRIKSEIHYLRDEKGKVLMDKQIKYKKGSSRKLVTAYLYGPKELFGFVRNNKLYYVSTDYGRSVRLVINGGRVVAAYDYLPYGQMMRSFGEDPEAQIHYRYSGQEWDEETGLYNFHARLYDPSIGRFYQPDPKMQYFSPYKYAGNSPISLIDPDGEFAFLIFIFIAVFAVAGAYLGGAAANGTFNPLDWDWKSGNTWIGIFKGAFTGVSIPLGFIGATPLAIVELSVNLGQWYLNSAAKFGSWNPAKWDWKSPGVYYGLFESLNVGEGFSPLSGFKSIGKSIKSLGKGKSILKSLMTIGFEVGLAYKDAVMANGNMAFWEWDWTSPETWDALLQGMNEGSDDLNGAMDFFKGAKKFARNKKLLLKNKKGKIFESVFDVGQGVMGCIQDDKIDFTSFDTYQNFISGVLSGHGFIEKGKKKQLNRRLKTRSIEANETANGFQEIQVQEIFPDRKVNFLSCYKHPRRNICACNVQLKLKVNKSVFGKLILDHNYDSMLKVITPIEENQTEIWNSTINVEKVLECVEENAKRVFRSIPESSDVDSATSGSSKPEFWPSWIMQAAMSIVPLGLDAISKAIKTELPGIRVYNEETPRSGVIQEVSPEIEFEPMCDGPPESIPDQYSGILDLGDQWIKNADVHGLLAWGVFLVKKWTGYKEPTQNKISRIGENTQVTIRSYTLLNSFIETLTGHFDACGISSDTLEELIDSKTYQKIVKDVGHMLADGRLDSVPCFFHNQLVRKNFKTIARKYSKSQAEELVQRMSREIPNLKYRLGNFEKQWFQMETVRLNNTILKKDKFYSISSERCTTIPEKQQFGRISHKYLDLL